MLKAPYLYNEDEKRGRGCSLGWADTASVPVDKAIISFSAMITVDT